MTTQRATVAAQRSAFPTLFRLLIRLQTTRGRLIGLGLLSGASILLAIITRGADDPSRAGAELLAEYGLGVVAPVCTLWLGASAIGDLVEDRTLPEVYEGPRDDDPAPAPGSRLATYDDETARLLAARSTICSLDRAWVAPEPD